MRTLQQDQFQKNFIDNFKTVCERWYGKPTKEQNGFKFVSEFKRTDGEVLNFLPSNVIRVSVFDNGTVMC